MFQVPWNLWEGETGVLYSSGMPQCHIPGILQFGNHPTQGEHSIYIFHLTIINFEPNFDI